MENYGGLKKKCLSVKKYKSNLREMKFDEKKSEKKSKLILVLLRGKLEKKPIIGKKYKK